MTKELQVIKFLKEMYPGETIRIFSDTTLQQITDQALTSYRQKLKEETKQIIKEEIFPITSITNPENGADTITKYKTALERIIALLESKNE